MEHRMTIRIFSALVLFGALILTGCVREHPIYQAQSHMIPSGAAGSALEQIEARIMKAAKSKGWYVDRIGPGVLQATVKWGAGNKHVAVVKIEFNRRSFNILHVRSVNLLEGIADPEHTYSGQKVIHRSRNTRVHQLESAIDHELYGSAS